MGRHRATECNQGHAIESPESVRERERWINGKKYVTRHCVICLRAHDSARNELKRKSRENNSGRLNFNIHEMAADIIARRGILKKSVCSVQQIVRQIEKRRSA